MLEFGNFVHLIDLNIDKFHHTSSQKICNILQDICVRKSRLRFDNQFHLTDLSIEVIHHI